MRKFLKKVEANIKGKRKIYFEWVNKDYEESEAQTLRRMIDFYMLHHPKS